MKSVFFFFFKSVIHDSFYANPLHFLNLLIRCGGLVHGKKKKKKCPPGFFISLSSQLQIHLLFIPAGNFISAANKALVKLSSVDV